MEAGGEETNATVCEDEITRRPVSAFVERETRRWQQLLKKGLLNTGDTTADVETTLRDGDRMTDATMEPDEVERDRRGSAGVGDSSWV